MSEKKYKSKKHPAREDRPLYIKLGDYKIDDKTWIKWGLKLISDGRINDALKSFLRAIKLNPKNWEANYLIGRCFVKMNKSETGMKYFEKAVELMGLTNIKMEKNGNQFDPNEVQFGDDFNLTLMERDLQTRLHDYIKTNRKSNLQKNNKSDYGKYLSEILNDDIFNDDNFFDELFNDESDTNHLSKYVLPDNINEVVKEPFDISPSKYKLEVNNSDIFPHKGGMKNPQDSFIEELLEYQSEIIDRALNTLMAQHGGCFHYIIEPKYLFRIGMFLLKTIIDDYQMDGVIVTTDKPATNIKKILRKTSKSALQQYYIDCNVGSMNNRKFPGQKSDSAFSNKNIRDPYIMYLEDNFNFSELYDAIEVAAQRVAELYECENHFVYIDNIAAFSDYTSESEIRKFIKKFGDDLRKMNMFGFFMIPEGSINLSLYSAFREIPKTITNKLKFFNK